MDVIVFAVVLIGLAAFIAAPLYRAAGTPAASPGPLEPVARREATDRAIEDLEVDLASGLLDEASYARDRAALDADPD